MFQGFFMSGAARLSLCVRPGGARSGLPVREGTDTAHMVVTGGQPDNANRKHRPP